ncbi:MAG: nucleoside deaminase [Deltaproteobacteria bacterium]|nr:nucleoside deaminase [Deltaproteobacteria bacterium]
MERHERYMQEALAEAEKGALQGEVPVGALLVTPDGDIIARAHNRGAMVQARLAMVVYGATDPKGGGIESVYQIGTDGLLNHRLQTQGAVLAEASETLLRAFFQAKR